MTAQTKADELILRYRGNKVKAKQYAVFCQYRYSLEPEYYGPSYYRLWTEVIEYIERRYV